MYSHIDKVHSTNKAGKVSKFHIAMKSFKEFKRMKCRERKIYRKRYRVVGVDPNRFVDVNIHRLF